MKLLIAWGVCIASANAFNVNLVESYIPRDVANDLINGNKQWTSSPLSQFATFYLQRNATRTDEYVCAIPREQAPENTEPEHSETDASLLDRAAKSILSAFPHPCMYAYELRGMYWTYAYCPGDKIIQYHEGLAVRGQDPAALRRAEHPNSIFVLGRFLAASNKNVLLTNQANLDVQVKALAEMRRSLRLVDDDSPFTHQTSQKVVLYTISDGSICDVTLQPRSLEVIYKCDAHGPSQTTILGVDEIKTCQYKMIIHVPGLCAIPPFTSKDKGIDAKVDCQLVDNGEEVKIRSFEDRLDHVLLRNSPFPVRSDSRISVADHTLQAMGRGFYLATSKVPRHSRNRYYNNRMVIVFNGFHELLTDLNRQVGRAVFDSLDRVLPMPGKANEKRLLLWTDSFLIWFEVYNALGELLGISRIERDASLDKKLLSVQMLDPETLLDTEGDAVPLLFDLLEYAAPNDHWNFESFRPVTTEVGTTVTKWATETATVTVVALDDYEDIDGEYMDVEEGDWPLT